MNETIYSEARSTAMNRVFMMNIGDIEDEVSSRGLKPKNKTRHAKESALIEAYALEITNAILNTKREI